MSVITVLRRGGRLSEVPPRTRIGSIDPNGPEAWILAVASRRDRAAFARLHAWFAPRLAGFLGRSRTADVEELVQETLLTVWRKAELYDPTQASAATWIFTIARNLRIDAARRAGRATFVDVADHDEIDDSPDGEALLLAGERETRVRAALAALPPEQADVVRMTYFTEKPQVEIARELGIPLGTVKSRLRLAANRLRTLLEGDR
jgi:RNA polymerase sigma-70 factor (ECF subfamily)